MTKPNAPTPPTPKVPGFWSWLFRRDAYGDRGLNNILNRWLPIHGFIGTSLGFLATTDAVTLAKSVALPGAAILVGLAFGWAGRSASLMQDKTFSKFLIQNGPPVEGYVYAFQLAVLAVLAFIAVALGLVAGGFDITLGSPARDAVANRILLFTVGSIAVREGWGVIYFVNKLTIQYYRLREIELEREPE